MVGYKHPDSEDGEVQIPVTVLNDDGTEVADYLSLVKWLNFVMTLG